jgi:hypothetical protein
MCSRSQAGRGALLMRERDFDLGDLSRSKYRQSIEHIFLFILPFSLPLKQACMAASHNYRSTTSMNRNPRRED